MTGAQQEYCNLFSESVDIAITKDSVIYSNDLQRLVSVNNMVNDTSNFCTALMEFDFSPFFLDYSRGLTVDIEDRLYFLFENYLKELTFIVQYTPTSQEYVILDSIPYSVSSAHTFYNGYLLFGITEFGSISNYRLVFYDIDKLKIIDEFQFIPLVYNSLFNMASEASPCQTERLLAVHNGSLVEYDFSLLQTFNLFAVPGIGTGNGTTTTEYLASMPEVLIDSTHLDSSDCGQATGKIEVFHRFMRGRGIQYELSTGLVQTSSVFDDLSAGGYTVLMRDTIWGCEYLSDTMWVRDRDARLPLIIETDPAHCDMDNGAIKIKNAPTTALISLDNGLLGADTVFSDLLAGYHTIVLVDQICRDSFEIFIEEIAPPTFSLQAESDHCDQAIGEIRITNLVGRFPIESMIDGGVFARDSMFIGLRAGMHVVAVRDSLGCVVQDSIEVVNIERPQIMSVDMDSVSCSTADGRLILHAAGVSTLEFSNGVSGWQSDSSFMNLTADEYQVYVRDEYGCMDSLTILLGQYSPPIITDVSELPSHCNQDDGQIRLTAHGYHPFTYILDNGLAQSSPTFRDLNGGMHDLQVIDAHGCMASVLVAVPTLDGPQIDSMTTMSVHCGSHNGSIVIFASNSDILTYSLDGGIAQSSPLFENLMSGIYSVAIVDTAGCSNEIIAAIDEVEELAWEAIEIQSEDCINDSSGLQINVAGGNAPYNYEVDGMSFSTGSIALSPGIYSVRVTDDLGCEVDTTGITINGKTTREISILSNDVLCGELTGSIVLDGANLPETISVNDELINTADLQDLIPGLYQIVIESDSVYCPWETDISIDQNACDFYIPTVFSPNNDGINDAFYVMASQSSSATYSISIYNRWGGNVFERQNALVNDQTTAWDGDTNGTPAAEGIYVYSMTILDQNQELEMRKGVVQLIR